MRIGYRLSRADLLHGALLQLNWLRIVLFASAGFFVAMAISGFGSIPQPRSPDVMGRWIALNAAGSLVFGTSMGLAYRFLLLPMQVRRVHRQNPLIYGDMELVADDQGIALTGPRSTTNFAWPDLRGFKEDGRVFLICVSKSVGFPVPKRDVPADIVTGLRALLDERLTRLK